MPSHAQGAGKGLLSRRGPALALAALLLAGCMSNFYSVPKPFEGKNRNDPMLDSILAGASLEVRPVSGLPPAESVALTRAISVAAHKYDIAAVTEGAARSADRLSGTAEVVDGLKPSALPARLFLLDRKKGRLALPGRSGMPGSFNLDRHTEVHFSWTLQGADGTVKDTAEVAQPISGTLAQFDKRERTQIAARTVGWLRAALDGGASPAQAQARRSKPIVLVSPVEGATGDGRVSLTTALAEMLTASGACDVLAASEQARIPKGRTAYRVKGRVNITDQGPGKQVIAIAWTLTDVVGREIGTVNQKNAVPRGSLDGPWGQTAYDAALGARDGLLALLNQAAETASLE